MSAAAAAGGPGSAAPVAGVGSPTLGAVGEFAMIERIAARLGAARSDTLVGAGPDDAAVLRLRGGRLQLATIDGQVDGVHFRSGLVPAESIGRKAAAVNLSDIAAMGGRPTHAVAALTGPAELPESLVLGIVDGLAAELGRWGADLVGGNLARGDRLVLDLALLGEVGRKRLLLRSGARPGDVVLVTGDLGAAAAGALLLAHSADAPPGRVQREPLSLTEDDRRYVLARQCTPEPRLTVAPLLRKLGATAAIDISDGLAADAGHLCERSAVGIRIEADRLPIAEACRRAAAFLGRDALDLALAGGEDYELLFTVRPGRERELARAVTDRTGVRVTAIGAVVRERHGSQVLADGRSAPLAGGWRHF